MTLEEFKASINELDRQIEELESKKESQMSILSASIHKSLAEKGIKKGVPVKWGYNVRRSGIFNRLELIQCRGNVTFYIVYNPLTCKLKVSKSERKDILIGKGMEALKQMEKISQI